ncbi:MAG: hypothetical protein GXY07_03625 [Candidatus Hydrogenedentes bacterium]|nr:hypothetical protein [Candidatus Hydrogenedentota bacterium]
MKLTVMKLICLLVLLGGIFILALTFDLEQAQLVQDKVISLWPKQNDGALNLRLPGGIAGALLVLLGGYGLLPRLPRGKDKAITFRGPQGDISVQLKPVHKVLLKVMRKMPEVYSIKIAVKPDADKRRASITADVVLKNCAALGARRCAKMVADCLAATAKEVLGLDDLSAIRVNIKGVHVDIGATGRQMRELVALNTEEAESTAYALAHPPVASVTLDEHSTDNRPVAMAEPAEDPEDLAAPLSEPAAPYDSAPEVEEADALENDVVVFEAPAAEAPEDSPLPDETAGQDMEDMLPPLQQHDDGALSPSFDEEVPEAQPAEDTSDDSRPETQNENDRWR